MVIYTNEKVEGYQFNSQFYQDANTWLAGLPNTNSTFPFIYPSPCIQDNVDGNKVNSSHTGFMLCKDRWDHDEVKNGDWLIRKIVDTGDHAVYAISEEMFNRFYGTNAD